MPIIRTLLDMRFNVVIGADGRTLDLLRREFPDLSFIRLTDYDIRYPVNGKMTWSMITQLPRLIRRFFAERKALQSIISDYNISGIISDNRFGLWSKRIPSVYMTHQVLIRTPQRLKFLIPVLYELHRLIMGRYREVWIPDFEGESNLSGELSHGFPPPSHTVYIGPLSRFVPTPGTKTPFPSKKIPCNSREIIPCHSRESGNPESSDDTLNSELDSRFRGNDEGGSRGNDKRDFRGDDKLDLLIILSGPEPQRTIFEKLILQQLKGRTEQALMVRGVTESDNKTQVSRKLTITDHLQARELNQAMASTQVVLARAGYSTIMDLAALGKRAILIPTPGQTEQEYLANELKRKGVFYSEAQEDFDLGRALKEVKKYEGIKLTQETYSKLRERIKMLFE